MELREHMISFKNHEEILHSISITTSSFQPQKIIYRGSIKYLHNVFIKYAVINIHLNQRVDTGENLWERNRELGEHSCWNKLHTPMWLTQKRFSCCQYSCLWSQPNNHILLPKIKKERNLHSLASVLQSVCHSSRAAILIFKVVLL